jgi:uncharacterized membrane protein
MRHVISLVGILLIIIGIVTLAYRGFTYTEQQKVAQIGSVQITANEEKSVYFPPLLGGLSLAAGIILVIASRMGSNK